MDLSLFFQANDKNVLFFQANDKNVTKGLFTKLFRLGGKIISRRSGLYPNFHQRKSSIHMN